MMVFASSLDRLGLLDNVHPTLGIGERADHMSFPLLSPLIKLANTNDYILELPTPFFGPPLHDDFFLCKELHRVHALSMHIAEE